MNVSHQNLKDFDKRATIEGKKVKEIATAMEKVKKTLEAEKKAYCSDFAKGLDTYADNPHLSP
jgi:hypothetical protein